MTDIVERLRDLRERFIFQGGSDFALGLANELDQLRAEVRDWRNVFGHLGETPDACGNALIEARDRLEQQRDDYKNLWAAMVKEYGPYKEQLAASQAREAKLQAEFDALEVQFAAWREDY